LSIRIRGPPKFDLHKKIDIMCAKKILALPTTISQIGANLENAWTNITSFFTSTNPIQ
jgi:hypothetical protein